MRLKDFSEGLGAGFFLLPSFCLTPSALDSIIAKLYGIRKYNIIKEEEYIGIS